MRERYGIKHFDGPVMELTTMIGCPLMCTFCPQESLRNNYGDREKYMQPADLVTVLAKLPKDTRIDFSGMSEPWANPHCTEMLETVLYMGFQVAIYTTLYGMKDPERVRKVLEDHAGQVEVIMLHLPDANGNMKGWKNSEEWQYAAAVISNTKVPCGVGAMTMDKHGVVHPDLQPMVGQLQGWIGHTRADSLPVEQIGAQDISITPRNIFPLTCKSTPFYDRNVLLPNGDVVLCCMDYDLKHIIGNLLEESYKDIFLGQPLMDLIEINESPEFSKCSICKSCENVTELSA
jgi:MoaA/NifB/PqqE/SkfB family radical SAM enzyme